MTTDPYLTWFENNLNQIQPDKFLILDLQNNTLFSFDTEDEVNAFLKTVSNEYKQTLHFSHSDHWIKPKVSMALPIFNEMMDWSDEEAW